MATGLYVPIRGDYTEFQKDIKRLQGIARQSAQELSDIFSNAFSKGDASRGLSQIGMALKKLGAAANTVGAQFKPAVAEISEFAQKCDVSANQVERLVTQMGYAARERQMLSSLRTLQRQAGLTDSALAQLARHRNLFAESGNIASEGLGVRTVAKIKADIREAEAAFKQFQMTANLTGESTQRQFEAMSAKVRQFSMELMTASQKEAFLQRERYNRLASQVSPKGGTDAGFAQFAGMEKARNAVGAFQELYGRLPHRAKEMRELAAATGTTTAQIWKMRDALDHSSNAFKALIGYGQVWLTFGFAHTAVGFVETAMALENVEVAFKAIYGTSDMAQKKLEFVRQVSDELGLSFMDTAEGAKKLFAAAQGTPIEAEANMVFKAFSNMSAAMKLTGDETKGVFLAISQMISKGKVSAEELRQQLAERMPGAVNLFAHAIGVNTQQLDKMLQQGGVTLEHFLQFARVVNEHYATGARQASGTLQAELARIGNTWDIFKKEMTDTGTLATWAREFNDVFKGITSAIIEYRGEVKNLMTAGLATWIASSLVPGGKLNAMMGTLTASFAATTRKMRIFTAVSTAMNANVTRTTLAVGKLRIALGALARNPLIAGLATGAAVFGIEKLLESGDEDRFAGEISSSGASIQEKLRNRMRSAAADKNSSFTPETIRKSLLDDIQKEMAALEKGTAAAGERFKDAIETAYTQGRETFSDVPEDQYIKMGEARAKAFEQFRAYQKEMQEAVDRKDTDGLLKLQDKILHGWDAIGKSLKDAGFKDDTINYMHDLFNRLHDVASVGFDDISKLLATFTGDAINAAKDLGLEMDKATSKMFEGLEKAASSSGIGKAAKDLENFNKVAKQLGSFGPGVQFDSVIASCGQYSDSIVNLTNRLDGAYEKHAEYEQILKSVSVREEQGYASKQELEKAQAQVSAQTQVLNEWQEKLAQAIFNASAAAGGSPAAFNAMISVFEQAATAAGWTAEQIKAIVDQLKAVRNQAIDTMNAAKGMAVVNGSENKIVQAEMRKAYAEGRMTDWANLAMYSDQMMGGAHGALSDYETAFKNNKAADKITDSFKKSGKKGGGRKGGGGKRVDNTAEKYDSAFEGFRKEIAKLQGEVDKVTLDKKFADMNKQLKGSTADIKALKKEYFEAFNANKVHELRKEIMQLTGDERGLAELEIADKMKAFHAEIDGVREAAKQLGVEAPEDLAKLGEAYEKALRANEQEQYLQKLIPVYEEIAVFEQEKTLALLYQNQLIDLQAEKMAKSLPPELVEKWREMKRLQTATDPVSGLKRGFQSLAKESVNAAQIMENAVTGTADLMSSALGNFFSKGKFDMQDFLNSWANMLMQMVAKAAISGLFNFVGGLFTGGGGGVSGAVSSVAGAIKGGVGNAQWAKGGAFYGVHGYANQIVSRPTLFSYGSQLTKFAKGGVMGEAGPEAVMPLTRMPNGNLGVQSAGSGVSIVINPTVVNNTGTPANASASVSQGANGQLNMEIILTQIDQGLANRAKTGKSQLVHFMDRTRGLSNAQRLYR